MAIFAGVRRNWFDLLEKVSDLLQYQPCWHHHV